MKTVGRMVAIGLAVMALLALVGTAPAAEQTAPAERGPGWIGDVRVMPALAVRETGWATGLRVSFLWGEKTAPRRRAPDLAKASAGKVYREEAVARWSPGYGELIAAAGVGVGDVNAVVKTEETPRTLTWPGRVGAWSYTNRWWVGGGGLLAAIVGVGLETDWFGLDEDDEAAASSERIVADKIPQNAELVLFQGGVGNELEIRDETGGNGGPIYVIQTGQGGTITYVVKEPEE